jgi:hypothetical protein
MEIDPVAVGYLAILQIERALVRYMPKMPMAATRARRLLPMICCWQECPVFAKIEVLHYFGGRKG